MSSTEDLDCNNLPAYLEGRIPAIATYIREEVEHGSSAWSAAGGLIRDVFLYRAFRPAVRMADSQLLDTCYSIVEELLSSDDAFLRAHAMDYVVPAVLSTDRWARESQLRAGPLLRLELDRDTGGSSWRMQEGGFGDDNPPSATRRLTLGVHLYRGEIFVHALQTTAEGGAGITRPFARMSGDGDPRTIGAVVSGMFNELLRSLAVDAPHLADELVEFIGGTDWRTFYTQSRSVDVSGSEFDVKARVWPRHKGQQGDWFGNRQGQVLIVEDWRDSDSLGRAVLTALSISSTTGWVAPMQ